MKLYFTTFDSGFSFRGQIYELISGIQNENTILFIFPSEKNFEATATDTGNQVYSVRIFPKLPSICSSSLPPFFTNNTGIVHEQLGNRS